MISEPKTSFLGVVFDGDYDFEGPRSPKAHLGTVNAIANLSLNGGSKCVGRWNAFERLVFSTP